VALAACGGSSGPKVVTTTKLRADEIPAGVAAVEKARGGAQHYTEINATPDGVNLFVVVDATHEVSYFFTDKGLGAASAPQAQGGTPYVLDGVDLTIGHQLIIDTQAKFVGSAVTQISIVTTSDLGVVWGLKSRSTKGGVLNVLYGPTGHLLSVAPE